MNSKKISVGCFCVCSRKRMNTSLMPTHNMDAHSYLQEIRILAIDLSAYSLTIGANVSVCLFNVSKRVAVCQGDGADQSTTWMQSIQTFCGNLSKSDATTRCCSQGYLKVPHSDLHTRFNCATDSTRRNHVRFLLRTCALVLRNVQSHAQVSHLRHKIDVSMSLPEPADPGNCLITQFGCDHTHQRVRTRCFLPSACRAMYLFTLTCKLGGVTDSGMAGTVLSSNSRSRAVANYDWKRASIDPRTFRFDYCSCDTQAMVAPPASACHRHYLPSSSVPFPLLSSLTSLNLPA